MKIRFIALTKKGYNGDIAICHFLWKNHGYKNRYS
jgi:hypothetical protein